MNGCVTTLSIDTGKCLDVEVLSKVCQGCQRRKDCDNQTEYLVRKAEHKDKCKANYFGSSASKETVRVKKIDLAAVKRATNCSIQNILAIGTAKVLVKFKMYIAKRMLKW